LPNKSNELSNLNNEIEKNDKFKNDFLKIEKEKKEGNENDDNLSIFLY
jgi:hypothetical protein